MAKTGPRPKPRAAIERSGSNQIFNRDNDLEVPALKTVPDCPAWLDETAKEIWYETASSLLNNEALTELDLITLALYCQQFSQFLKAEKEHGGKYVITTKTGAKKTNPALDVANKAWEKILKISKEFGLTPASRAGLAPAFKGPHGNKKPNQSSLPRLA